MSESKVEAKTVSQQANTDEVKPNKKLNWETPTIEDVSEEVMAQPYIRFT